LIEVEPHPAIALARYGWAKDLLLTLASIGEHARAEAEAAADRLEGSPEARLNLLLLLCAAEQVAADHLVRGGLDLSPARRLLPARAATTIALTAVERTAEWTRSVRVSIRDRATVARIASLRRMALGVAESIARDESDAPIAVDEIGRLFAGVPQDLAASRMKIPSCFRAQDITPLDCFALASRFVIARRPRAPVLVVGVRTSGSYMAPLVAGWLRANGLDAAYTTVRPKAPFVSAERSLIRRWRDRLAVIVDDPPMTGVSYLRTARRVEECGIPREAITLMLPIGAESAFDVDERRQFSSYHLVELSHRELAVRQDLDSPELLSFVARAAGNSDASVTPLWSPDEIERRSGRRHVKQVYEVEGCGRVHVKGVGVGWFGYPARLAAEALVGLVPEPLGFFGTLMATRGEPEAAPGTAPSAAKVARYVAQRARALGMPESEGSRRFQKDAPYRLAKVIGRVHGPLAAIAVGRVRRLLMAAAANGPRCLIDGRMGVEEWVGSSARLKSDFEEHAFDKDDLGVYDPAYDVAGAVLELGPSRDLEVELLRDYINLSGDAGVSARFGQALLLYGAFLLERRSWEVGGQRGTPGWPEAVQTWLTAESAMTWAVDRLLGNAFPGPQVGCATATWSIDVDGVLEDAGLGFPATTPAGALALQLAREASAAIVLNSGRSLPELVLRCDALRLDGAVAEYGSAIWDASTGLSESLLETDELAALDKVRRSALCTADVHVDRRYRNSVRLRRFVRGRPSALDADQIAQLLEGGPGGVRVVQGVRQTDIVSSRRDKQTGLESLRARVGLRGDLFAIGDSEPDRVVASKATRAYAPHHRDDSLARTAVHLSADRQRALLEAVRRQHRVEPRRVRPAGAAADVALVRLLALRDAPRAWRAVRAFGPGMLEVFKT
jgi:hydroxymethylpyrimidine pyrophosphatase-like HAD family hydrolase